ncbi:hypothetical protein MA16_Dca023945 [Dendrobium catenatum]|uniref:Uncharacterized protein n=1 Tax=Dendrobium catenatum TaxID=906689 RepID=A0A2I0V842_9ASPA|nr:hypothetical protein MA16_Dca023945 [Dendrobium catenatum]
MRHTVSITFVVYTQHGGGGFLVVILVCFESMSLSSSIDFLDATQPIVIASRIIDVIHRILPI